MAWNAIRSAAKPQPKLQQLIPGVAFDDPLTTRSTLRRARARRAASRARSFFAARPTSDCLASPPRALRAGPPPATGPRRCRFARGRWPGFPPRGSTDAGGRLAFAAQAFEACARGASARREHRFGELSASFSAPRSSPPRARRRSRALGGQRSASSGSPGARPGDCLRRSRRGTAGLSGFARCFCRASRAAIHSGKRARSTG